MAKKKKEEIKIIVTVSEKGELNVNGNISPLATLSLLGGAIELISTDLIKASKSANALEVVKEEETIIAD